MNLQKPNSTKFLHELQNTLEQASKAETIPSLELLSNKLKCLRGKLSKNIGRRQEFQDLITKCEKLVKQKLRSAKIKGKNVSPLSKSRSEQQFKNITKCSQNTLGKATKTSFNEQQYSDLKDKLVDIRKEIRKQKQQKSKLKTHVQQLQQFNKEKQYELEYLKENVSKLHNKIQRLEHNSHQSQKQKSTEKNYIKIQNRSSLKDIQKSHNLYTQQKDQLLLRFQQRISQKNSIIGELQQRLIDLENQNYQLKSKTGIKSSQYTQGIESLRLMLKSSNDKLQIAIKQKSDLKQIIKQLESKNIVFVSEIDKLVLSNSRLKNQIQKSNKIIEYKLNQQKKHAHFSRHNLHDIQTDKMILFDRLDSKDQQIQSLKTTILNLKHDLDLISLSVKSKDQKIFQLQQRNYKKDIQSQHRRVQLTRVKSEQFNNTLKTNTIKQQARRTQANINKSLDITKKLNALQGIRNIIRRFPH